MPHRFVAKASYKRGTVLFEKRKLSHRKSVFLRIFRNAEMGIYRLHFHLFGPLEVFHKLRKFIRSKSKAVHPGIELDMDRIIFNPLGAQDTAKNL